MNLQRAVGNQATEQVLRGGIVDRQAESHPPPFAVKASELTGLFNAGEPLPTETQTRLSSNLGADFSSVRLHADAQGDYVAKALGAEAFSFGKHIAMRGGPNRLGTAVGSELLSHEARHIVAGQTAASGASATSAVQLKVSVDDVTAEMIGQSFKLLSDQGTGVNKIPKGSSVIVRDWKGTNSTATVEFVSKGKTIRMDVPKLALEPETPSVKGIRRYSAGVPGQRKAVEKAAISVAEQDIKFQNWKKEEKNYKKKHAFWEAQLKDLEKELNRRKGKDGLSGKETELSRMLVRETMYNRFDTLIAKWVTHYNDEFKPKKNLDPNLVKSMLFQESEMGTSGVHLELPPYSWSDSSKSHPVKTRFNIGQAVDSSGHQQLLMIKEMAPDIFKKHDLEKLENEDKKKGKSEAEMYAWDGGKLVTAMKEFFASRKAGKNLVGTDTTDLNLDYSFWIRTAVRWLYQKYNNLPEKTRSWEEAARAYNGSGSTAEVYQLNVVKRLGTKDYDASAEDRGKKHGAK